MNVYFTSIFTPFFFAYSYNLFASAGLENPYILSSAANYPNIGAVTPSKVKTLRSGIP